MRWPLFSRARGAAWLLLVCSSLIGARLIADDRLGALPSEPFNSLPAYKDGDPLDVAAQKGWKVVYFWSETCPCVQACEQLNFMPLSRQYRDRVSFFAIASNTANITMIGRDRNVPALRLSSVGNRIWPPYPILVDLKHTVADALHASYTPETFLLDPENRVVFHGAPDDSTAYEERTKKKGLSQNFLGDALAEALAGKTVSRPVSRIGTWCAIDRSEPKSLLTPHPAAAQ